MAAASFAKQLQFDYLSNTDTFRALQGFEALEQAILGHDPQMEFGATLNSNTVEKNKLGTILNIYNNQAAVVENNNHLQHQNHHPNTVLGYANSGNPVNRTHHITQVHTSPAHDFSQYLDYVDSPPDSKEAWPVDYLKSGMQVPNKMVGIEGESRSVSGPNSPVNEIALSKKRRMNWEDHPNAEQNATVQNNSNQVLAKDQLQMERRKMARFAGNGESQPVEGQSGGNASIQQGNAANASSNNPTNTNNNNNGGGGAGTWGDEIDFDLNNELSSNGYMNDTLFYHSLGAFKQEVPSPTQDKNLILKQGNASGNATTNGLHNNNNSSSNEMMAKRAHGMMPNNDGQNGQNSGELQAQMNVGSPEATVNNGNADIINSLQAHQLCHIQQAANNGANGNGQAAGNATGNALNDFQQLLQENSNHFNNEKLNGNVAGGVTGRVMTPPQMDKPLIGNGFNTDCTRFQYVLAAATSIATKNNEDTLTYLNQGQSYEIKLKKLGDLTNYRNKVLTSVIKICFYERRLQYMEREQMQQWQVARPGERILEIDVPLSFGCHPSQSANPNEINKVEVMWDPMKEVGVYIKVNCISTEFTPKKHGGEKGVPFRIQVETFLDNKPVHGAMCQIKVFKLKGADRKHKQDREKIQKRPASEQDKFQPSYECTILNDISRDLLNQTTTVPMAMSPSEHLPAVMHSPPTANGNKFDSTGLQFAYTSNSNSSSSNSLGLLNRQGSTSNPNLCKTLEMIPSPPAALPAKDFYEMNIQVSKDTTPQHLTQWINYHRLSSHLSTFAHFSGSDLLRLTKDDLIQICGLADGIRMYNILHKKAITPRLTIFVSFDGACFHAVYLYTNKLRELMEKTQNLPGFRQFYAKKQPKSEGQTNGAAFIWEMQGSKAQEDGLDKEFDMLLLMPSGIHVMMTEDVISHIKDESSYLIVVENRHVILRPIVKE